VQHITDWPNLNISVQHRHCFHAFSFSSSHACLQILLPCRPCVCYKSKDNARASTKKNKFSIPNCVIQSCKIPTFQGLQFLCHLPDWMFIPTMHRLFHLLEGTCDAITLPSPHRCHHPQTYPVMDGTTDIRFAHANQQNAKMHHTLTIVRAETKGQTCTICTNSFTLISTFYLSNYASMIFFRVLLHLKIYSLRF
jgi:hypothetical protein